MRKWQYLRSWAPNHKTKGTFPSQTLKVEEKKVVLLFFYFWPRSRDMDNSCFEAQELEYIPLLREGECQYNGPLAINKKKN